MGTMEFDEFRASLDDDFRLLRAAVVAADPAARVPTCPDWNLADLAGHVAEVYLHKAECIRLDAFPDPWPPETSNPDPVAALDETYAALLAQFAAHSPADHAATWYEPDQTVGFWIRRMAQETVIHRVDAELAAGSPPSPIRADLAVDGIDEVLKVFVGYGTTEWRDEFADLLDAPDERELAIGTGQQAWVAVATPAGVRVSDADAKPSTAAAAVEGEPEPLLLWLWNRADDSAVQVSGDASLHEQFRRLRAAATE
jgi:uncharacterized protein (TIGR03083 family)